MKLIKVAQESAINRELILPGYPITDTLWKLYKIRNEISVLLVYGLQELGYGFPVCRETRR